MPIALPNLDDRRWVDLVEEGRALIPFYSPEWTDHNVHDPGITLIELFAWLTEMDIFHLDRITERNLRKFLALVGIYPQPSVPALAPLSLSLKESLNGDASLPVPISTEFEGRDSFGVSSRFRSLSETNVVAAQMQAIQVKDQKRVHDLTSRWLRAEAIEIYGPDPVPGLEFYLGFDRSFPVGVATSLLFITQDLREAEDLRRKILLEQQESDDRCHAATDPMKCCESAGDGNQRISPSSDRRLVHHSLRLVWEFLVDDNTWHPLSAAAGDKWEVIDDTRSFTLNGRILFKLPVPMAQQQIGEIQEPLHYLRCRIAGGSYDAPPILRHVAVNGVFVEQVVPATNMRLRIAASAIVDGTPPEVGGPARFHLKFNQAGEITRLSFVDDETAPAFRLLEYSANAGGSAGLLSVEAVLAGKSDGLPNLSLKLSQTPALESGFRLFTLEHHHWREWLLKQDLIASRRADAHFTLEQTEGVVRVGDGERGRVPPRDAQIIVSYDTTRANEGNLQAGRITDLADSAHNHAILADSFNDIRDKLSITNGLPASGGASAETLAHAIGRAIEAVDATGRAVTLADCENLARQTPGVRLARVSARANLYSSLSCLRAAGIITVIVLPYLPADRPTPSPGLRRKVANYLFHRRVIGTRVEVIGPVYVEVTVHARVKSLVGTNKLELQQRIVNSLNKFFHPLTGGPDGTGWPFGRDVFRSEVLQVIDETEQVDHVLSLELAANCAGPQCGNLCLGANELVAAGRHEIEVV
jgi:hypothetical protein